MSSIYKAVKPINVKSQYVPGDQIEIPLSYVGQSLLNVRVVGKLYPIDSANPNPNTPFQGKRIYYDNYSGADGLLSQVQVKYQAKGTVDFIPFYGRHTKRKVLATKALDSLGTETDLAARLIVATQAQTQGMLEGVNYDPVDRSDGGWVPFVWNLEHTSLNTHDGPMPFAMTGSPTIYLTLANARDFIFGPDYVEGTTTWVLRDLVCQYTPIPTVKEHMVPITYTTLHVDSTSMITNVFNVNLPVTGGLCDSVTLDFISQTDYDTRGLTNGLQFAPPPGIAPYGADPAGFESDHYGIERLRYSINDNESSLVTFQLVSREELVYNGLRVYNGNPLNFGSLIRRFCDPESPDCYFIGVPFGSLIDLSQRQFGAEIYSQIVNTDPWFGYVTFRMVGQMMP
jgi:hypothetical protein